MQIEKFEHCYRCGEKTINGFVFCPKCTIETFKSSTIDCREFGTIHVSHFKLRKLDLTSANIMWWLGTDALTMEEYPVGSYESLWFMRIFFRRKYFKLIEGLISEHWVVHGRLAKHLINFGIAEEKIKIVPIPPLIQEKVKKRQHNTFNILAYYPQSDNSFKRWKYGLDVIDELRKYLKIYHDKVRLYLITGVSKIEDMKALYAITDLYIRPSRHDGLPRMNLECEINYINYYYSSNGEPNLDDIIEFFDFLFIEKE